MRQGRHLRFLLTTFLLQGCLCFPIGPPVPVPADTCDGASSAALASLEVEQTHLFEPSASDTFRPALEGQVAWVVRGIQGGNMIGLRLGVPAGGPECIAQQTRIVDASGSELASSSEPVKTYAAEGRRVTRTLWLPGNFSGGGERLTLTVSSGGKTVTRQLIEEMSDDCGKYAACSCSEISTCVRGCNSNEACVRSCLETGSPTGVALHAELVACQRNTCSPRVDGGSPADAGSQTDAGNTADAGVTTDAGRTPDGGDWTAHRPCRQGDSTCMDCSDRSLWSGCSAGTSPGCGQCNARMNACSADPNAQVVP